MRICEEALGLDADARPAYLEAACRGDAALRREVESVLAGSRSDHFLESPPWPEEASIQAGRRLGPYEVIALIGEGGMGAVYRARDTRLGRIVAIKVIGSAANHPAGRERFAREAHAIAVLNHPHICALHDIGHEGDQAFLVMEHLEGVTLASRLASTDGKPAMKLEEALECAIQVAEGLAAAHAAGIVHRDLKPSNVMLTPTGVKLLDFGLAKHVCREAGPSDATVTMTGPTARGAVLGTVGYTSPEQARGEAVDARSDIFSFGCVLYEMLAGHHPFRRASGAETTSALLTETPPPPSALNAKVTRSCDEIVLKALEKDRDLRYQSGAEMRVDLLRAKRELAPPSSHASGAAVVARRRRQPWRLVLVASAVLAALGALFAAVLTLTRASGGVPPFEPRRVTVGLGFDSDPALSPDGNFLAYASEEGGNQDVWLLDLRNGSTIRRTSDAAPDRRPAWMSNGAELLFVSERDGKAAIWRMPALDGPAVRLVADADDVAVSPDGTRIAFVRAAGPTMDKRVAVAPLSDVSQPRFLTADGDGLWEHRDPAWSPDGKTICYRAQTSLWVVELSGGKPRQLLAGEHPMLNPAWSTDGERVYFSSSRDGTSAIWRTDLSGRRLQRVTPGTGPESQPVLSADGRTIVFGTARADIELVFRRRDTGQETAWGTTADEIMPVLTRDARAMFFVLPAHLSTPQVWSLQLEDGRPLGKAVQLTDHAQPVSHPSVSPDGRWVAYYAIEKGTRCLWVVPAAGGQAARVTDGPRDTDADWSADGRHLLFAREEKGIKNLWQVPVREGRAAGPAVPFTRANRIDGAPVSSPDGLLVAFTRSGATPGNREAWVMPAAGGEARQVTRGAQAHRLRWDGPRADALLVCGKWGGRWLEVRRVLLRDGSVTPLLPQGTFGPLDEIPDFSVSGDGRLLAFARYRQQGNIWIGRALRGRF